MWYILCGMVNLRSNSILYRSCTTCCNIVLAACGFVCTHCSAVQCSAICSHMGIDLHFKTRSLTFQVADQYIV